MNPENAGSDVCAVCHAAVNRDHAFCRFQQGEGRVTLCNPGCAHRFLLGSPAKNNGASDGGVLDELLAEWRWRERGE